MPSDCFTLPDVPDTLSLRSMGGVQLYTRYSPDVGFWMSYTIEEFFQYGHASPWPRFSYRMGRR